MISSSFAFGMAVVVVVVVVGLLVYVLCLKYKDVLRYVIIKQVFQTMQTVRSVFYVV